MSSSERIAVVSVFAVYVGIIHGQDTIAACDSPIFCQGQLLDTIQKMRLFSDSKTFVDMSLKNSPDVVLSAFNALQKPVSKLQARAFLDAHFSGPGEEFEHWAPEDLPRLPSFLTRISDTALRDFGWDLCRIWKDLGRKIKSDVKSNQDRYSLVYLPHPFIVPGGRFRETYYWDTYWVIKGLLLCEMTETVKGMLENFVLLIQRFGLIPNGGRIYYIRRSQPPLFIPMMYDYYRATGNLSFIREHLSVMETEYDFWMTNRSIAVQKGGVTHLLNRYASPVNTERPESYYEDSETASSAIDPRSKRQLHQDLVSAAESGWDFSSRWFSREQGTNLTLDTIRTTNILPVDLNSILCMNEHILSLFFNMTGNNEKTNEYTTKWLKRQRALRDVLWNPDRGVWQDLDIDKMSHRDYFYASNISPLYASCIGNEVQLTEDSVLDYLQSSGVLRYAGGFPTSLDTTGQQWDFPNGWPPLQHMAIWGMSKSQNQRMKDEAMSLGVKWTMSNWKAWFRSRNMYEKYSTTTPGRGGSGGEYLVQEGFGWSNGVVLELLNRYGDQLSVQPSCDRTSAAHTGGRTSLHHYFLYLLFYLLFVSSFVLQ
ncbi:trehalase-like [Crassostrea virginica]